MLRYDGLYLMNRLIKDSYIPLGARPLGDNHKSVQILTSRNGLLYAAAFGAGGKQSRLRALIQPFSLCEGELYFDPVKNLWRLKDGNCLEMRDSFHENLSKYYAALFWSELIRKTDGGAGSHDFFQLTRTFLQTLERTDHPNAPTILVTGIWHFLDLEGIRPDLNNCSRCGRTAPVNKAVCYDTEGHVVCSSCRLGHLPVLSAGGRSYLNGEREFPSLRFDRETLLDYLLSILVSSSGFRFDQAGIDIILGAS